MSFPVNVKDITVGKTVVVEPLSRRNPHPRIYLEGVVEKVGRKYFYVRCRNYSYLLKIDLETGRDDNNFAEYQVYPDIDTFKKEVLRKEMLLRIRNFLDTPRVSQGLSYGTTEAIYNILGLPDLGEPVSKKG